MRRTQNRQTILKKKNRFEGFIPSKFEAYYKAIVIKTMGYWHEDKYINQQKHIGSPEINPYTYGQLHLIKVQGKSKREKIVFSTNVTETGKNSMNKKMTLDPNLTPSTKIKRKLI